MCWSAWFNPSLLFRMSFTPVWSHFLLLISPFPLNSTSKLLSDICHSLQIISRSLHSRGLPDSQYHSLSSLQNIICIIRTIWTQHWGLYLPWYTFASSYYHLFYHEPAPPSRPGFSCLSTCQIKVFFSTPQAPPPF